MLYVKKVIEQLGFKKTVVAALLIVAIISIGVFYYYQKSKSASNITQISSSETTDLISRVGKLTKLPVSEQPAISTFSESDMLTKQPFFRSAKSGDKVIIYPVSRKAILYRPSDNKIIVAGTINFRLNPGTRLPPPLRPHPLLSPRPKPTVSK